MLKILCHRHMLLLLKKSIVKKLLERFAKKDFSKTNKRQFGVENLIKRKKVTN